MYYGQVAANTQTRPPETFRDVGPDQWGFEFRQHANGTILIREAPVQGLFGGWLVGARNGYLKGRTLTPKDSMWHKVTRQIGEHPYQTQLRQIGAGAGPSGRQGYTSPVANGPYSGFGSFGAAKWVQSFSNLTSGFTTDPQGDEGAVIAGTIQAIPGIQATIAQIARPSDLDSMTKRLGRLKGQLSATRDPMKIAVLTEQIGGLEYKIANLKSLMGVPVGGESLAEPMPWWPFAAAGAMVLVGAAALASKKKKRGRR